MPTDYPIEIRPDQTARVPPPPPEEPVNTSQYDPHTPLTYGSLDKGPGTEGERMDRTQGFGDPYVTNASYGGPQAQGNYNTMWGPNLLQDPENYMRAREAQARNTRNTETDPRNYLIGRTPEGAQQLRDYADREYQEAMRRSGKDFVGYGQDLKADQLAVANSAVPFGQNQHVALTSHGALAAQTADKYGDTLESIGRDQITAGETGANALLANSIASSGRVRDATAGGEVPSAAMSAFNMNADRSLLDAARTGNRAGLAREQSGAGASAGRMRVGETNAFRDLDLRGRVGARNNLIQSATAAGDIGSSGYDAGLSSTARGVGTRTQGMDLYNQGVQAGYGVDLASQELAADAAFAGYGDSMTGYEGAADVELGGLEDAMATQNLGLAVDEADLQGRMQMFDDRAARYAAWRASELKKEEAEQAERNAWIKAGTDAAATFVSWV